MISGVPMTFTGDGSDSTLCSLRVAEMTTAASGLGVVTESFVPCPLIAIGLRDMTIETASVENDLLIIA